MCRSESSKTVNETIYRKPQDMKTSNCSNEVLEYLLTGVNRAFSSGWLILHSNSSKLVYLRAEETRRDDLTQCKTLTDQKNQKLLHLKTEDRTQFITSGRFLYQFYEVSSESKSETK